MPTPIVRDRVRGREGSYTVSIYDTQGDREQFGINLLGDVVIEYGELERSSARQVLKSFVRLNFLDEGRLLHNELKGGFKSTRYVVEILGSNVEWHGFIKEESRTVPFDNRIERETTNAYCYGGIVGGRLSIPDLERTGYSAGIGAGIISMYTTQLSVPDYDDERLRSDVVLEDNLGIDEEVCQIGAPEGDSPINRLRIQPAYEALKKFAEMSKNVLYKSLSEGCIVWDAIIYVGRGGDFKTRFAGSDTDTYELKNRKEFVNDIDLQNFIIEGQDSGFQLLEASGNIIVNIDNDANLAVPGAHVLDDSGDDIYWEQDPSNTVDKYAGTDVSKDVVFSVGNDGTENAARMYIGEVNPSKGLGILLTWDTSEVVGTPSVTLNYRGNTTLSYSVSDASSTGEIVGAETSDLIDPEIIVDGTVAEVRMKVQYTTNGKILEQLVNDVAEEGIDEIEIEEWMPPLVGAAGIDQEPRYIKNEELSGVKNAQPFLYQAQMDRKIRPFGTRTARAKLLGLYGPEYVHRVSEDSGDSYWVATGLKCNLKTGITEMSLVEIPVHYFA